MFSGPKAFEVVPDKAEWDQRKTDKAPRLGFIAHSYEHHPKSPKAGFRQHHPKIRVGLHKDRLFTVHNEALHFLSYQIERLLIKRFQRAKCARLVGWHF